MNDKTLRDKILGCFNGKNIGGTLGAPLEGKSGFFNIDYFLQPNIENNPAPNDDLDLQLAWFHAVRRYGRRVNAEILSEYWSNYILPSWAEYGVGKSNVRRGITPPLSGFLDNTYKDSCGGFIRSEIWACLFPGNPSLATRYAYFDASVDHADDGLYGEVFWAAIQSAAFVESDTMKLLEIGKSFIPKDCTITKVCDLMIDCYKSKKTYEQARDILFKTVPGAFAYQHTPLKDIKSEYKPAKAGFDAPNNIGIAIMAWLYGENDFGKSILYAANCAEDADCSCGTLAATLGIILGNEKLPEKWVKPIGNVIIQTCVNIHDGWMGLDPIYIPKTTTEFAEEIVKCIPKMMPAGLYNITPEGLEVFPEQNLTCHDTDKYYLDGAFGNRATELFTTSELVNADHYSVFKEFSLLKVRADFPDTCFIKEGQKSKIKLNIFDNGESRIQRWLSVKVYAPEGVEVSSPTFTALLNNTNGFVIEKDIEFTVNKFHSEKIDLIFDIIMEGQVSTNLFKLSIFAK